MQNYIAERVLAEAQFIIKNECTIRELSNIFKVSIGTVHNDLTNLLKELDEDSFLKVREILNKNSDRAKQQIKFANMKNKAC